MNTTNTVTIAGASGIRADRPSAALFQSLCKIRRPSGPSAALRLRAACVRLCDAQAIGNVEDVLAATENLAEVLGSKVQEDPLWEGCFWMITLRGGTHAIWVDMPSLGDFTVVENITTRRAAEAKERR